jgi:hypothetical protein
MKHASANSTGLISPGELFEYGKITKKTITPPTPITPTQGSITVERKVNYACTECRKAHKACSGGRPCDRCVRNGTGDRCQSSQRKKRVVTKKSWTTFLEETSRSKTAEIVIPIPSPSSSPEFFPPTSLERYRICNHSPSPTPTYMRSSPVIPSLILAPIREENFNRIEHTSSRSSSTYLGCLDEPSEYCSSRESLNSIREITRKMEDMSVPSILLPAFRPEEFAMSRHQRFN